MFFRLGRGVVRHPWLVIGIWIVAAVAIIGLAPKLATSSSESSFLPSHYQSVQAQNLQQSAFPAAAAPGAIVVADNMLYPEKFRDEARAYRQRVRAAAGMSSVLLAVGNGLELSRYR